MSVGTGAETLQNIPVQPYVQDPASFFSLTSQNVAVPHENISTPGQGAQFTRVLAQVGVISKIKVRFVGTATVTTAAATSSNRWPYGLLSLFRLSANGQNDLWSCDGLDLTVLRDLRYPSFAEGVAQFPGTIGGGDSIAVAVHNLDLCWEIPFAMDDVSLVGSLFAQSSSTNLTVTVGQANNSDLFSANPGNVVIAGAWSIEEVFFEIPYDDEGKLILPDLSRLHGFNAFDFPFTQTGEVRASLIRSQGQLHRLLVSAQVAANNRASALPSAAATRKIDEVRLEYGANQRPYTYRPAASLLERNNQHYGGPPLYDRLVFDFAKENPLRDVYLMQGVTELAAIVKINTAATVSAGQVRLGQETLF